MSDRTPEQVMAEAVRSRTFGLTLDSQTVARRVTDALREAGFVVVPISPTDKMVEAARANFGITEAKRGLVSEELHKAIRAAVAANEGGTDR